MKYKESRQQATERAFQTALAEYQNSDNLTALLKFLAESLEEDTTDQMRRFWSKILSLLGLIALFAIFCDYSFEGTPEQRWAFSLIPLAFFWLATVPTASPLRPVIVQATTEVLLTPVVYSSEQKQLIVRITETTLTESSLRELCIRALDRSA